MIAVSLLMPASMLCLLLALGRYEERMLGPGDAEEAPAASDGRRLRAVPDPSSPTAPGAAAEPAVRPRTGPIAPGGRRPMAGPGTPRRAA
ncbi:hypothetical protein [Streptomyces sp. NPDC003480]